LLRLFTRSLDISFQKRLAINYRLALIHRRFHMALLSTLPIALAATRAGFSFDQAGRHRTLRSNFESAQRTRARCGSTPHRQIFEVTLARDTKAAMQALQRHYS
jgi:DNA-binding GntR family transcriptional regulator